MNWPTQVYGASIIDYELDTNKSFVGNVLDAALGFSYDSQAVPPSGVQALRSLGFDKLLVLPFHENPVNSTGNVLARVTMKFWVDYFMNKGELTSDGERHLGRLCTKVNHGLQKGNWQLIVPGPLYRSSTTLYMSWSYDPSVRLQPLP